MNDQLLLNQAWRLIEEHTERSVDGVGLLPWRPHDIWSAISAVAPDFASYYRLNAHMNESAHQLFGTAGMADVANLTENQLRHVFQHAMAADDDRLCFACPLCDRVIVKLIWARSQFCARRAGQGARKFGSVNGFYDQDLPQKSQLHSSLS